MRGKLVISALVGITLMLSLSFIPAYAIHEKEVMIFFKNINDSPIKNAECKVTANDFDYFTITNSFGFATVVLPGNTSITSVECFYNDSSEGACDIILRHGTTKIEINVNPDNLSQSCY